MDQGSLLDHFAQVRRQVITLCSAKRFSAAQMLLVGSGLSVADAPGLWEHIARRAAQAGHDPIAHEVRKTIWQAGGNSAALSLQEAAYFLNNKDHENCIFVIEGQFGPTPNNIEAHEFLTRAYLMQAQSARSARQIRTKKDIAHRLTKGLTPRSPAHAMAAIDLLRFCGSFERAIALNEMAQRLFPQDVRFLMRNTRMLEQKGQFSAAIPIWQSIAETSDRYRIEALLRLHRLQERLELIKDADETAAHLLTLNLPIENRLILALHLGLPHLVQSVARLIAQGGPKDAPITFEQGQKIGEALLDHGEIGLLVWLRRQRLPLSDQVKVILDQCAFGEPTGPAMPDSFDVAAKILSPDFMLPLEGFASRPPKPPGWPGSRKTPGRILLVNASLKAGGAERQFVSLIKSMIDQGVPKDTIDVAFFSLETDRDMDRFLPDLADTGVTIHDLSQRIVHNPALPKDVERVLSALPIEMRNDLRPLWHLISEVRPNVLHGWQDRAAISCGLAGYLTDTERVVLSTRNMSPATRRDKKLRKAKALFADFAKRENYTLTANSELGAQDYIKWLSLEKDLVKPLRNIVDVRQFETVLRGRKPKDIDTPITIGGVFRLALNKRPLLWLNTVSALRELLDRPIKPVIFGDGPMREAILTEAKALGCDDLEIISSESAPTKIYSQIDALLLMSRVEGLPNVMLEAQAAGLPVAACEVGGVREAAQKRGDARALLLPAQIEAKEAAEKIANWLPTALSAKPDARVGFVRTHFGPKATIDPVLEIYCGRDKG